MSAEEKSAKYALALTFLSLNHFLVTVPRKILMKCLPLPFRILVEIHLSPCHSSPGAIIKVLSFALSMFLLFRRCFCGLCRHVG